jgi:hypothetical protein
MSAAIKLAVSTAISLLRRDARDVPGVDSAIDLLTDFGLSRVLSLGGVGVQHLVRTYRRRLQAGDHGVQGASELLAKLEAETAATVLMDTVSHNGKVLSLWFDGSCQSSLGFTLGTDNRPVVSPS